MNQAIDGAALLQAVACAKAIDSANASASTAMSVDDDNAPILRSLIASAFRHRTFGPVRASTKHKWPCRWPCIRGLRGQGG